MTISIQDEIAELERELAMRRRVFPTWIGHKLSQATADHRITCLESTLARLKNLTALPGIDFSAHVTPQSKPSPMNPLAMSVSELATPKQIVLIRAICRDLDIDVDAELTETMKIDCKVEELSRRAASSFIDHLKQLQEGSEIPIVRRAN